MSNLGRLTVRHILRVYSILIHTGKGKRGRVKPEKRLEGQQFTKLGRKNQLNVSLVYKL
jgi:hypothetical protein